MKTTRILGFVAGLLAVVALIAIGFALITDQGGVSKTGILAIMAGMGVMAAALLLGIVHFLLRIKFRNPYHRRRGPQAFLRAGRVMVWAWGVAMIATAAMLGYLAWQLGPALFMLLMG